ncbi:MAG: CtsR family transcriptional regulator [Oscillospiraceae bacterium]
MGMSDVIAEFIDGLLQEDSTAELQRAELANKFGCVPSQINYVISTRFSPERGYVVESRRGGGGYIRIRRVQTDPKLLVMHTVNAIGSKIDLGSASALLDNCVAAGVLSAGAAQLMLSAVGDAALRPVEPSGRDVVRAAILKQMLLCTM